MRISIVIPTYRPKEYLWQCLMSIEHQTLSHELFEVLLVLNGDREPYEQQINNFLASHPTLPCRLIYNDKRGVSAARNKGIDEAKGEYLCFIDDDDYISPTYLQELLNIASRDVVAASYSLSIFQDSHTEQNQFSQEYERHVHLGEMHFVRPKKIFSVPWMKLIHRDIIGKRRFNESFSNGEDAIFMFEISDCLKHVRFTSTEAVYYWTQRDNSLHLLSTSQLIHKYCRMILAYLRLYVRNPLKYNQYFFLTRILAAFHGIIARK